MRRTDWIPFSISHFLVFRENIHEKSNFLRFIWFDRRSEELCHHVSHMRWRMWSQKFGDKLCEANLQVACGLDCFFITSLAQILKICQGHNPDPPVLGEKSISNPVWSYRRRKSLTDVSPALFLAFISLGSGVNFAKRGSNR